MKLVTFNDRELMNFEFEQPFVTNDNPPLTEKVHDEAKPEDSLIDNNEVDPKSEDNFSDSKSPPQQDQSEDSTEDKRENLSRSESFGSHIDSRPYGARSVAVDITFNEFNYVYGIPEHADSFVLKSTIGGDPYRLYNLDVFEYELYNPMALYGSVPLMWAHKPNSTVGIFWHNPSEMWIDIMYGDSSSSNGILSKLPKFFTRNEVKNTIKTKWISESGVVDVFVILGNDSSSALYAYTSLTGATKLPPLFALANHQCRWNYKDEDDVQSVSDNYDKNDIPLDTIWLDIEYAQGKRYFTWDEENFPTPNKMVDKLLNRYRKMVIVIDPHIKRDTNWNIYREAEDNKLLVKNTDGSNFEGWCWPGSSVWPDFIRPEVENWWSEQIAKLQPYYTDSLFVWNDMNEPSVFSGPEITMPKDLIHGDGWEHRDIHNVYGLRVHRSTWEGLLKRSGYTERPFVLTRAFFAGSQRSATVWTGDNAASWDHLQITTPMLLSLSITGITFCGADVGGFFGAPSEELLIRWYQAAAFHPFLRAHAHMDTKRREPYLYSDDTKGLIRTALRMRYSFLPYLYTTFARAEYDGQPVMAPLWFHFPADEAGFPIDDEFMVGEAIMIHPVVHERANYITPYFPPGIWYLQGSWKVFPGNQWITLPVDITSIPLFYRSGWIVPKKERIRRSSMLMQYDPYTFIVSVDPSIDKAQGYLYLDDFHSTNFTTASLFRIEYKMFKNDGDYGILKMIRLPIPATTKVVVQNDITPEIERIVFIGLNAAPIRVSAFSEDLQLPHTLEFTYSSPESFGTDGSRAGLLVVRKPRINVSDTWQIRITFNDDHKH